MLTDSSLSLITFINLFFIPLISLQVYCKRNSLNPNLNFETLYKYALFCVLMLPFTRIICSIIERILKIVILADSTKYTIIALIASTILPFIIEIIEHYIKINVCITYKNSKQ